MKLYETPNMQVIRFESEEILAGSIIVTPVVPFSKSNVSKAGSTDDAVDIT